MVLEGYWETFVHCAIRPTAVMDNTIPSAMRNKGNLGFM